MTYRVNLEKCSYILAYEAFPYFSGNLGPIFSCRACSSLKKHIILVHAKIIFTGTIGTNLAWFQCYYSYSIITRWYHSFQIPRVFNLLFIWPLQAILVSFRHKLCFTPRSRFQFFQPFVAEAHCGRSGFIFTLILTLWLL